MKEYLYLIPFKDNKYFKIGISTKNFDRVYKHLATYKADRDKCFIVTCKKGFYSILEKELLTALPTSKTDKFNNLDGYTEIRHIKHFQDAICIIKSKHKNLNVEIKRLSEVSIKKTIKNEKPVKKKIRIYKGLNRIILNQSFNDFIKYYNEMQGFILNVNTIRPGLFNVTVMEDYFKKQLDIFSFLSIEVVVDDKELFLSSRYGVRCVDMSESNDYRVITFDLNTHIDDRDLYKEKYPVIHDTLEAARRLILKA